MNAILWSSLRDCLSIFSKTLLVFLFVAMFSPGEAILDAKAIFFFFYAFTGTRGEKQAGFANETQDGKLRVWRLKQKNDFKDRLAGSSGNGAGVDLYYVISCFEMLLCLQVFK